MSFVIEGFIRYHRELKIKVSTIYDNVIFFPNGWIGESGFSTTKDCFLSFTIGVTKSSGESKSISNLSQKRDSFLPHYDEDRQSSLYSGPMIGIWFDEAKQQTFLFRDPFGTIPLFYIDVPGDFLAFSTSIANLLSLPEVKNRCDLDLNKILIHGSRRHPDVNQDASSTFFRNIKSCNPGHLLTIDSRGTSTRSIVTFKPERWEYLKTFENFTEVTRELFLGAITKTVGNGLQIVGSDLSGGLDSSSICGAFRHLYPNRPLHTFHILANNSESDESRYAELMAKNIRSVHHLLNWSTDDLQNLKLSTGKYGQPDVSLLSPATKWEMLANVQTIGCDIILNGLGGDSIIGHGNELLDQSFDQQNWPLLTDLIEKGTNHVRLSRQFSDWNSFSAKKKYHLLLQNFLYHRFSAFRTLPVTDLFNMYKEVSRELGISYYYFFRRIFKNFYLRTVNHNVRSAASIMRDDLSENSLYNKINFPLSLKENLSSEYDNIFEDVFHPHIIKNQEQSFVLGNHFGISIRSPFMNHELFELCLAVPNFFKYGDGIGRAHLREAMKGILIEEVRRRNTKSSLSSPDGEEITLRLYHQSLHYLHEVEQVWQYVDKRKFNEQLKILFNKKIPYVQKSTTYFYITRTISLSVWLEWLKDCK